jgi:glycosyltransferase involved in cell wall biosynthesis
MKLSICVPTWNRFEFTVRCFEEIINDERIFEFVISDDCSTDGSYEKLLDYYKDNKKVKIFRNENRGKVHINKMMSIKNSTGDFCVLFDSDNIIKKCYIDRLFEMQWQKDVILQPSFAKPNFDYRNLIGKYDSNKIKESINLPLFECMLNTQNFFVNRTEYLNVWEDSVDINGADSIFFNYLWIKSGKHIEVVENLEYEHTVHRGSFYESVAEDSIPKALNIVEKLKNL